MAKLSSILVTNLTGKPAAGAMCELTDEVTGESKPVPCELCNASEDALLRCRNELEREPTSVRVLGIGKEAVQTERLRELKNPENREYRYRTQPKHTPKKKEKKVDWQRLARLWLRGSSNQATAAAPPSLLRRCAAEMVGVCMIVVFGCGSVATSILSGAQQGLWQVASVWGFGVALSIYCTSTISGAHLNPAMSLAFALLRPEAFGWGALLPYAAAQLVGGILGGALNLALYGSLLRAFERAHGFQRGDPASVITAAAFGEYFPNPGFRYDAERTRGPGEPVGRAALSWDAGTVTTARCLAVEAWGTALLAFVVFALTDRRSKALGPQKELAPYLIGFAVAALISLYAPLTMAGLNPARDLGPRLVAWAAGWGSVALPGPRGGFWAYVVGPLVGAPLGALLHEFLAAPLAAAAPPPPRASSSTGAAVSAAS